MGRISPGTTRWPPGAERHLVPANSNLKPQTSRRRQEKERACGTSPQAQPHAHTPPRHITRVNTRTLAHPEHPGSPACHAARRARPSSQRRHHLTPRGDTPWVAPRLHAEILPAAPTTRAPAPVEPKTAAEPPRGRPSPTTRPTLSPTVAHCNSLPSQPPPQNVKPNPVQNKPSALEADGRQHTRQRTPLRPTGPNPSPQPSKLLNPPQPPSQGRSLHTSREPRATTRNL